MGLIKKKYIFDKQLNKIAVQIPVDTFKQNEEILENYALIQLMDEKQG